MKVIAVHIIQPTIATWASIYECEGDWWYYRDDYEMIRISKKDALTYIEQTKQYYTGKTPNL